MACWAGSGASHSAISAGTGCEPPRRCAGPVLRRVGWSVATTRSTRAELQMKANEGAYNVQVEQSEGSAAAPPSPLEGPSGCMRLMISTHSQLPPTQSGDQQQPGRRRRDVTIVVRQVSHPL